MTTRKPRAPAHMLRRYTVHYRNIPNGAVYPIGPFSALSSTGALVQAAHRLARVGLTAVEIIATEQGE
jgi:hypothetical protein